VRTSLLSFGLFAIALTAAACADAPITAADLQSNGELLQGTQNVHSTAQRQDVTQRAAHLHVTGLLAAQADGPLEDATRFSAEVEAIHLHLRADDISEPRPVTFVWTHHAQTDVTRETLGFLQPTETLSLSASLPVLPPEALPIAAGATPPSLEGAWKVQVFSTGTGLGHPRSLLFEREFEILGVEQFELLAVEQARGVPH
jgi:hypothetical protein